jgi:HD superfamily phosphohydrolase
LRPDTPKSIGPYIVKEELGPGSYAMTYRVKDKTGQPLALKWCHQNPPPGAARRFENEVWALKTISHDNVPKYEDHGVFNDQPYLVLEYASGQTAKQLIADNLEQEAVAPGLLVASFAQQVLSAFKAFEDIPLVHRDIKPANLIVSITTGNVKVIDFGLCKSDKAPSQDETFWPHAASRYSHPGKMEDPSSFEAKYDVFSLGVVCYELLTNALPWDVEQEADYRDLIRAMRDRTPVPLSSINKIVDPALGNLIMEMISIPEHRIPSVVDCLSRVDAILRDKQSVPVRRLNRTLKSLKLNEVIRDPLHGDIRLTDFEGSVLQSRELQRLKRVRQLGFAHIPFPGAEHSRLLHMIGTLHVTEKILQSIETREGIAFDPIDRQTLRLYALLHDLGHGPFGHTMEDELGFYVHHDDNPLRVTRILDNLAPELRPLLQTTEWGRLASELLERAVVPHGKWIRDFVSSKVGPDILDYIDRDSLFCGLDHRVDSAIFRRFNLDQSGGQAERRLVSRLFGNNGFRLDADYGLVSLLRERYALFLKVYTHAAKVAAAAMLGKALQTAIESNPEAFDEKQVEQLGDDELLMTLRDQGPPLSRNLALRLLEGKLYEPVFRSITVDDEISSERYYEVRAEFARQQWFSAAERAQKEREIAHRAKMSFDDVIVYFPARAPGAQTASHPIEVARGNIISRSATDRAHLEIFKDHVRLWNIYVFVPPELPDQQRTRLTEVVSETTGRPNQNAETLRQQLRTR